uniref:Amiloride-sensitive sodium channel n=1 Tax=Macrostomum lignano TaxID=282301 RepID=A0A1I8HT72_9PLAT
APKCLFLLQFELFHAETSGRSAQLAVMGVLRMLAETFVFNTSMRGFMKLYKTPHRFLRCLWALYAISMLSLWITACYFLIEHYSGFYVTVQQSERIQDITPLPSITLCSQAPMGDHAASLWSNGTIMSPMHLHAAMKRSMRNAFGNGTSRRLSQFYAAKDVFYADKISTYFQNIDITEARRIGMRPEDLLVFCLMKHTPNNNPSVSHDEICRLSVKWVRHPLYLNCYTVTVDQEDTLDVSSVSLILRSGVAQPLPLQGHVFDLFSQSQGLKISLHEQGSHPNIDESAISVGMGRNTEIRYTLVQHRRLNLGNQRSNCLDSEKTAKQRVLRDFDETYNYTFDACMSQAIGQLILGECNCVSAFHLVTQVPTRNTPFCHYHEGENTSSLLSRLDCVRNIKLPHRIAQLRTTTCLRRCNFNQFDMQVSSAQWMPTRWQLKLVLQLAPAWDIMIDHHSSEAEVAEARRRLMSFIDSPNEQRQLLSNTSEPDISRLTLVTVSRATYNTILKTETLQVTLSTLLAQIGGLGSVTIGLTITVLFEVCEYFYLTTFNIYKHLRDKRRKRKNPAALEEDEKSDDDGGSGAGEGVCDGDCEEDAIGDIFGDDNDDDDNKSSVKQDDSAGDHAHIMLTSDQGETLPLNSLNRASGRNSGRHSLGDNEDEDATTLGDPDPRFGTG